MIRYLDPSDVIARRQSPAPPNRSRTGYGNRIPTSWELQLVDHRWRRVYVICWSNAGSAYIRVAGDQQFLGSYDPAFGR